MTMTMTSSTQRCARGCGRVFVAALALLGALTVFTSVAARPLDASVAHRDSAVALAQVADAHDMQRRGLVPGQLIAQTFSDVLAFVGPRSLAGSLGVSATYFASDTLCDGCQGHSASAIHDGNLGCPPDSASWQSTASLTGHYVGVGFTNAVVKVTGYTIIGKQGCSPQYATNKYQLQGSNSSDSSTFVDIEVSEAIAAHPSYGPGWVSITVSWSQVYSFFRWYLPVEGFVNVVEVTLAGTIFYRVPPATTTTPRIKTLGTTGTTTTTATTATATTATATTATTATHLTTTTTPAPLNPVIFDTLNNPLLDYSTVVNPPGEMLYQAFRTPANNANVVLTAVYLNLMAEILPLTGPAFQVYVYNSFTPLNSDISYPTTNLATLVPATEPALVGNAVVTMPSGGLIAITNLRLSLPPSQNFWIVVRPTGAPTAALSWGTTVVSTGAQVGSIVTSYAKSTNLDPVPIAGKFLRMKLVIG